VTVSDRLTDWR